MEVCLFGFGKRFGSLSLVNLVNSECVRNVLGSEWEKQTSKNTHAPKRTDVDEGSRDLF